MFAKEVSADTQGQKNSILRILFIIFLRGFESLCKVKSDISTISGNVHLLEIIFVSKGRRSLAYETNEI